jgi:hypothetical protein
VPHSNDHVHQRGIDMSNNPKENQNIESEANDDNEEQEESMEGEGSATLRPLGDSDPSIKNH